MSVDLSGYTWIGNDTLSLGAFPSTQQLTFYVLNGSTKINYTSMDVINSPPGWLVYNDTAAYKANTTPKWQNNIYKTVYIGSIVTDNLYNWLNSNGTLSPPPTKKLKVSYGGTDLINVDIDTSASISIKYKSTTTPITANKTLLTNGKLCTDNIQITYGSTTKTLLCKNKKMSSNITITIS